MKNKDLEKGSDADLRILYNMIYGSSADEFIKDIENNKFIKKDNCKIYCEFDGTFLIESNFGTTYKLKKEQLQYLFSNKIKSKIYVYIINKSEPNWWLKIDKNKQKKSDFQNIIKNKIKIEAHIYERNLLKKKMLFTNERLDALIKDFLEYVINIKELENNFVFENKQKCDFITLQTLLKKLLEFEEENVERYGDFLGLTEMERFGQNLSLSVPSNVLGDISSKIVELNKK